MRIYLVGYMGSGKTSVGKGLANKLGYTFVDLDSVVEYTKNKSILQIFEEEGEQGFRKSEEEALISTFKLEDTVIAVGGGAPCFHNNMEQMNSNGLTVYIELTAKALVSRLKNSSKNRPLIKDKSEKELLVFIEDTLSYRKAFYQKAKKTVQGLGLTKQTLYESLKDSI